MKIEELETQDIFFVEDMVQLLQFVEEFIDILDQDFSITNGNGDELIFNESFLKNQNQGITIKHSNE